MTRFDCQCYDELLADHTFPVGHILDMEKLGKY
jgi:hypothetical protein